jgi:hypothetical protein
MSEYTKINISEVTDLAPQFGMGEMGEARFARQQLRRAWRCWRSADMPRVTPR